MWSWTDGTIPMLAALVRVRGDRAGTYADEEGLFTLPVPEGSVEIEVLRGASATAMYGSKGTNGIVLITTRRGGPAGPTPSGPSAGSEIECFLAVEGGTDDRS